MHADVDLQYYWMDPDSTTDHQLHLKVYHGPLQYNGITVTI